jgi:hypothetical protein
MGLVLQRKRSSRIAPTDRGKNALIPSSVPLIYTCLLRILSSESKGIMLKLNISYPNGVVVSLECNDPNTYPDLMSSLKPYLTPNGATNGNSTAIPPTQDSPPSNSTAADRQAPLPPALQPDSQPPPIPPAKTDKGAYDNPQFIDFCKSLNPGSDMKRVIVAAEGAKRFLNMSQVSPEELQSLLRALQWPQPEKLVLTLRNAARSSYRWLQRVPGRRGYYTVTEQGRLAVMLKSPVLT